MAGLAGGLAGCDDSTTAPVEAGVDAALADGGVPLDTLSSALAIDFTVAGCSRTDAATTCTGAAPLTVTFVPITSGDLSEFFWTFGDNTQSTLINPQHTFALPGRYDVTVIGGGAAGAVSRQRAGFIVATTNPIGAGCDVNAQCEPDLSCVCGSADQCAAAFARGLCSRSCRDSACPGGAVCADLTLSGGSSEETPWRKPLCLAACGKDADCAAGLRCRDLPGRFPAGRFVRACFAEIPAAAGSACRTAGGLLDNSACVTGLCADLGAFGLCSQTCDDSVCPPFTACARFGSGANLCLPVCTPSYPCTHDPLLACGAAGGPGPASFVVANAAPEARFCAAKICQSDAECAPTGVCQIVDGVGHCRRK